MSLGPAIEVVGAVGVEVQAAANVTNTAIAMVKRLMSTPVGSWLVFPLMHASGRQVPAFFRLVFAAA